MSRKRLLIFVPPVAIVLALAALSFGKAARGFQTSALQKKRVAARGHLTGTKEILHVVISQVLNSKKVRAGEDLRASLHTRTFLAIETTGPGARVLWRTDGGTAYNQVSDVQTADLDGDGVVEIMSLWWENPSVGAALRVFHWDREKNSFVELSSGDNVNGIHQYRIERRSGTEPRVRVITYVRDNASAGRRLAPAGEYVLRGSEVVPAGRGERGGRMDETSRAESGIEGQAVITPTSPVLRANAPRPDPAPFETGLVVLTAAEGREVARLKTGPDGRFRVALPPGNYIVKPLLENRRWPRGVEQPVTVMAGKFAQIIMTFDSGMR